MFLTLRNVVHIAESTQNVNSNNNNAYLVRIVFVGRVITQFLQDIRLIGILGKDIFQAYLFAMEQNF